MTFCFSVFESWFYEMWHHQDSQLRFICQRNKMHHKYIHEWRMKSFPFFVWLLTDVCNVDISTIMHFLCYMKSYENEVEQWCWYNLKLKFRNWYRINIFRCSFLTQPLDMNILNNALSRHCRCNLFDWHRHIHNYQVHWIDSTKWHLNGDKIEMGQWSLTCM